MDQYVKQERSKKKIRSLREKHEKLTSDKIGFQKTKEGLLKLEDSYKYKENLEEISKQLKGIDKLLSNTNKELNKELNK